MTHCVKTNQSGNAKNPQRSGSTLALRFLNSMKFLGFSHLRRFRFYMGLMLCAVCAATGTAAKAQTGGLPPTPTDTLDYSAPWSTTTKHAPKKDSSPKKSKKFIEIAPDGAVIPAAPVAPAAPADAALPAVPAAPSAEIPPVALPDSLALPSAVSPLAMPQQKARNNELAIMAAYFQAQGNVVLPFGFSLSKLPLVAAYVGNISQTILPARDSKYFGASFTHAFNKHSFADLSYSHGSSSGSGGIPQNILNVGSTFKITDNWFQAYYRYIPKYFDGKRFIAYGRVGATFVLSDFAERDNVNGSFYQQKDTTHDILGNLGYGLSYQLPFSTAHHKFQLQQEGEGFFGYRSQKSQESIAQNNLFGPSASVNNTLFGGLGRLTLRYQYYLGNSGRIKLVADGGIQVQYTLIHYSSFGTPTELLWGPYIRAGVRYSF